MKKAFPVLLSLLLAGCGGENLEITHLDTSSGIIDLSVQLPGDWERVCVLKPYTTSESAGEVLGFEYDIFASNSGVFVLDDRNLLVTTKNNSVIGEYDVLLMNADFTSLEKSCFAAKKAIFTIRQTGDGWNKVENT